MEERCPSGKSATICLMDYFVEQPTSHAPASIPNQRSMDKHSTYAPSPPQHHLKWSLRPTAMSIGTSGGPSSMKYSSNKDQAQETDNLLHPSE